MEKSGRRRGTAGDDGDDTILSVLILAQDGQTAPLRTLCILVIEWKRDIAD